MSQRIRSFAVEGLKVEIFSDRKAMREAAGQAVAGRMKNLLKEREKLCMVFAAAPSQNEFLEALSQSPGIDWKRVIAFHLDEYIGLPSTAPQNFGQFLRVRLFEKVQPGEVHYLNGTVQDPEAARRTSMEPVTTACPATILRKHENAILFLDQDSARLIESMS